MNRNYINSVKGHLNGTGDLNYLGYVDALQEIQFNAENAKRQLDKIKESDYKEFLYYLADFTVKRDY